MPATRRSAQDAPVTEPYTLVGASKPQLAALTVAALKSHLKHYHLPTTGNKAALVDRLHYHLCSLQDSPAVTSTQSANPGTPLTPSQSTIAAGTQSTNSQSQNPVTPSTTSGNPTLPQHLIEQLATYFQQCRNPPEGNQPNSSASTEEDNLSVASGPTYTNNTLLPTQTVTSTSLRPIASPIVSSSIVTPPVSSSTWLPAATVQPPLPHAGYPARPHLPAIPTRIKDKIARGEYIDFATLLPKAMFSTHNPLSQQSVTFQLTAEGNSYALQPTAATSPSTQRISSFANWMEAWNVYLSVRVALNPACAPELIHYQCIITTANSNQPLSAWLNYDTKFRTRAASDQSLRWDCRDPDLWLECFTTNAMHARWPCPHCGATNHFPDRCPFRPSPVSTGSGDRQPSGHPSRSGQPPQPRRPQTQEPPICYDYNQARCYRAQCNYAHKCTGCGGNHPAVSCPSRGQRRHH